MLASKTSFLAETSPDFESARISITSSTQSTSLLILDSKYVSFPYQLYLKPKSYIIINLTP